MAITKVTNGVSAITHDVAVIYVAARCILSDGSVGTPSDRAACELVTGATWTGALSISVSGGPSTLINVVDLLVDLQLGDLGG